MQLVTKSVKKKINVWARHKSRKILTQALYQWHFNQVDISDIAAQFQEANVNAKVDWPFFILAFTAITTDYAQLDQQMAPFLDRPISDIDIIEKAILRLAIWELTTDTPVKVVINEAIELAKEFAGTDSFKYINGIVDAAAKHQA
jgi:N utilization substance protein B